MGRGKRKQERKKEEEEEEEEVEGQQRREERAGEGVRGRTTPRRRMTAAGPMAASRSLVRAVGLSISATYRLVGMLSRGLVLLGYSASALK